MELNKKALFNENGDIELSKRKMINGNTTNLNDFNKMKEIRFKPSFNVFDIQSVLVYKWSVNDVINTHIQNQVKAEEEQQNKENSQTN